MFALFWASLCGGEEPVEPTHEWVEAQVRHLPQAGWDPLLLTLEVTTTQGEDTLDVMEVASARPTVIDAEGSEVELVPATWHDYDYGFVAEPPMSPGPHTVTHLSGYELPETIVFEISDHGQEPAAFDEEAIYLVTSLWGPGIGDLATELFADIIWLDVLEVTEDDIAFRVIVEWEARCEFFVGRAEVDDHGNLHWEHPGYTVNEDEVPFDVTELRLDLALGPDGDSIAGGEATVVLDTRPIDEAASDTGDAWDTCELVAAFGVECLPCSDGVERCLALGTRGAMLERVDRVFGELPTCGADFSNLDLPEFDFDFGDCASGCSAGPGAGAWGTWLVALAALRRRRRADSGDTV